jgi:hypothetical protein
MQCSNAMRPNGSVYLRSHRLFFLRPELNLESEKVLRVKFLRIHIRTPKQNCHPTEAKRSGGTCSSPTSIRSEWKLYPTPCYPDRTPDFLLAALINDHLCGFL